MRFSLLAFLALVVIACSSIGLSEVYINEILADPDDIAVCGTGKGDCTEWLELYNSGDQEVDLINWKLYKGDNYIIIGVDFANDTKTIPAKGFLALTVKVKKFGLTNSGSMIKLVDSAGGEVDLVAYPALKKEEAYARVPDGSETWKKQVPTKGVTNGKEPEPEVNTALDDQVENNTINDFAENTTNDLKDIAEDTTKDLPKEEPVEKKESSGGEKVTGKVVYESENKSGITKPLILLLIGVLIVIVALQVQLMRMKKNGREDDSPEVERRLD